MPGQIDQILGMLGGGGQGGAGQQGSTGRGPSGQYPGEDDWKKQRGASDFPAQSFEDWVRSVLGVTVRQLSLEERAAAYSQYASYLNQFDERKRSGLDYKMKDYAHETNKWTNWLNTGGNIFGSNPRSRGSTGRR